MLSGNAKIAGVIGHPISHSLSPKLHGFWLDRYQIDGTYIPLAVVPSDLKDVIVSLPKMGLRGVNITVPHKEAVMEWMDEIEDVAIRIGAVNTIVIKEGKLIGTNTDAYGFIRNILASQPVSWKIDAGKAVVIGAGGAARAVIAGLQDASVSEIILTNRTRSKAEELAAHLGGNITVIDWKAREAALENANLLVNTTSLGMIGQPPLVLDISALPTSALVTDIVYKPLETALLKAARERGNKTVDGLGMLLHQAVRGFEAWFGVKPEVTQELRQFVLGIKQ